MDNFKYGGENCSQESKSMVALIDSGNTTIQIPHSMYSKVMTQMRKHEKTIFSQVVDGNQILVARQTCENLYDKLESIEFDLQSTKILIKPRGYLYSMIGQSSDCFIGIQSIPDTENHFRLGTIFLRNFYTALDYDHNLIAIGVNAQSSGGGEATIIGKTRNPLDYFNPDPTSHMSVPYVILCLVLMFVTGIVYYVREHNKVNESDPEARQI